MRGNELPVVFFIVEMILQFTEGTHRPVDVPMSIVVVVAWVGHGPEVN